MFLVWPRPELSWVVTRNDTLSGYRNYMHLMIKSYKILTSWILNDDNYDVAERNLTQVINNEAENSAEQTSPNVLKMKVSIGQNVADVLRD